MPARADLPPAVRRRGSLFAPSERTRVSRSPPAPRRQAPDPLPRSAARRSRLANIPPLAFAAAIAVVLFIGWYDREEGHLTPATGTGYWLRIPRGGAPLGASAFPLP